MRRPIVSLLVALLAGSALFASQDPGGTPRLERAHRGDGALDAPVPAVGEAGGPSRILDATEMASWLRGRAVFDRNFHRSDGCGAPNMNADSCRACHQDPAIGGAGPLEVNVSRMGHDGGDPDMFVDVPGGQGLSKLRPPFAVGREEYDPLTADVFEQRQTPTLFGVGDIDAIPESAILANEDPTDADQDGVFGYARMIDAGSGPEVGRFGWKAQIPRAKDFARDAMGAEVGITTPDSEGRGFSLLTDGDGIADPELSQQDLDDLIFFITHLARPKAGQSTSPLRAQGEMLFDTVGCAVCHVPSLPGAGGLPVPLFSDLLLHDVMPDDYRGMGEPGAPPGFFRTPPLWGLCKTAPYMHDGRAETIDDAIRNHHHGEADGARLAFLALTDAEREALLHFLGDI